MDKPRTSARKSGSRRADNAGLSTRATAGFNVFIELSVVHFVPHMIADRLTATEPFDCARVILGGIETMHMIKKGQMTCSGKIPLSAAQQFNALVS